MLPWRTSRPFVSALDLAARAGCTKPSFAPIRGRGRATFLTVSLQTGTRQVEIDHHWPAATILAMEVLLLRACALTPVLVAGQAQRCDALGAVRSGHLLMGRRRAEWLTRAPDGVLGQRPAAADYADKHRAPLGRRCADLASAGITAAVFSRRRRESSFAAFALLAGFA